MSRNSPSAHGAGDDTFTTTHAVLAGDARSMRLVDTESIDLVVTSPPYPLIEMWDDVFRALSPPVARALATGDGAAAFESMHAELDLVWAECLRVLRPGGFLCVNIGDAARTIDGEFRLWPNHARALQAIAKLGFVTLPDILWRKPSNAPNKFMGSGMLPAGAYVTYEHEYVLIARKGAKRAFASAADKRRRMRSAFFWEERNAWFSDLWIDLRGATQALGDAATRARSAAYPFELPYRLVNMLSLAADTVLDPFLGAGTTLAATVAAGRNGIGIELDGTLLPAIMQTVAAAPGLARARIERRFREHLELVERRTRDGKAPRHRNAVYDFPVVTRQEQELRLWEPIELRADAPGRCGARHAVARPGVRLVPAAEEPGAAADAPLFFP
jgi:modification methylase